MNFKKLLEEKSKLSPICEGEQLTTDELVGKNVLIGDVDIVAVMSNGKSRAVAVCKIYDEKKKYLGYYHGGQTLTDILGDAMDDDETVSEMKKDGLKIRLEWVNSVTGNTYIRVKTW